MKASCHPDRPNLSGGLCEECWPRRNESDPDIIAARKKHLSNTQAAWYWSNAEHKRKYAKKRYEADKLTAKKIGVSTRDFRRRKDPELKMAS